MTSTQAPQPTTSLMKARDVALRMNVSVQAVYKWKDQGVLPFRLLGGTAVRFERDDVEAFIRGEKASEAAKVVPMTGRRRG